MVKNRRETLKMAIGIIAIFVLAVLVSIVILKFTYHKGFIKNCYRVCYYDSNDKIWEYRPWGYNADFTEEDRDFPSLETCLSYCLSQKQVDLIKSNK